jgi:hypothetical protein
MVALNDFVRVKNSDTTGKLAGIENKSGAAVLVIKTASGDHEISLPAGKTVTDVLETVDPTITATPIGHEYCWDHLSEVKWGLLQNNLEAAERVLKNPSKFPKADHDALRESAQNIRDFTKLYGDHSNRPAPAAKDEPPPGIASFKL